MVIYSTHFSVLLQVIKINKVTHISQLCYLLRVNTYWLLNIIILIVITLLFSCTLSLPLSSSSLPSLSSGQSGILYMLFLLSIFKCKMFFNSINNLYQLNKYAWEEYLYIFVLNQLLSRDCPHQKPFKILSNEGFASSNTKNLKDAFDIQTEYFKFWLSRPKQLK